MHHLSVLLHKISLKFSSWIIMLRTKRAHQSTNFETFVCFNESSPNSSCQFWNHKVKVYLNFASLLVSWKITPLYFFSSNLYTWDKKQFSEWLGENSQNSLCHHSVSGRNYCMCSSSHAPCYWRVRSCAIHNFVSYAGRHSCLSHEQGWMSVNPNTE